MAQDEGTGQGEAAACAPQWLMDLKARSAVMRERRERPAGLCFGRWLGDFLDQDTPSGLLPAEENAAVCRGDGRALRAAKPGQHGSGPSSTAGASGTACRDMPHSHADADFAEALTRFLAGAPEAVQEVVHEATMQAVVEIGLPADWEPKDAAETEKLASLQHEYFGQLEAEAHPARTVAEARGR